MDIFEMMFKQGGMGGGMGGPGTISQKSGRYYIHQKKKCRADF